MLTVNSAPLSLCKIFGAPKRRKISKICVETKVGLTSSSLPDEIISKISTGDDLKDITNTGVRNDFDFNFTCVRKGIKRLTL
jgi:hypothetical protein